MKQFGLSTKQVLENISHNLGWDIKLTDFSGVFEGGSFDLVGFEGRIRSEHVVFSIQQYVYSLHLLEVIGNIYDKPETIKNANS